MTELFSCFIAVIWVGIFIALIGIERDLMGIIGNMYEFEEEDK